jgi:serine/threonine protein kinase
VDWWSFGVFVYELNAGKPPFSGSSQKELYASILSGQFTMPKTFSYGLADLCRRLIETNVNKRLGCSLRGGQSNDVRDHKWFDQIDWLAIHSQKAMAPFVPKSVNPVELANKTPQSAEEPLKIARTDRYKTHFVDF